MFPFHPEAALRTKEPTRKENDSKRLCQEFFREGRAVTVLHGQHSLDGAPCVGDPEISALDGSILERVFRWLGAEPPGGRRARDLFALARWGALPADQGADASLDRLGLVDERRVDVPPRQHPCEREASGYEHPCERKARERDIRLRALRALLVTAEVLTPRGHLIHPWRWSSRLGPVDPSF